MQVLTGQYPTLYTHKLRITYADLNTLNTAYRQLSLLTLPKAQQVVFVQMFHTVQWAGTGVTAQVLRLWQAGKVGGTTATVGYFISHNNFTAPSTSSGSNAWVQPRLTPVAPLNNPMICNQTSPTEIILTSRTSGANNNMLTAGSTDIWITVMKTP